MLRPVLAGLAVLAALILAVPASAGAAPTLRLTAKTESTISVAWTASSGATRYDVTLWENSPTVVPVPRTQTSHTFTGPPNTPPVNVGDVGPGTFDDLVGDNGPPWL